jgi:hypothetical protein
MLSILSGGTEKSSARTGVSVRATRRCCLADMLQSESSIVTSVAPRSKRSIPCNEQLVISVGCEMNGRAFAQILSGHVRARVEEQIVDFIGQAFCDQASLAVR